MPSIAVDLRVENDEEDGKISVSEFHSSEDHHEQSPRDIGGYRFPASESSDLSPSPDDHRSVRTFGHDTHGAPPASRWSSDGSSLRADETSHRRASDATTGWRRPSDATTAWGRRPSEASTAWLPAGRRPSDVSAWQAHRRPSEASRAVPTATSFLDMDPCPTWPDLRRGSDPEVIGAHAIPVARRPSMSAFGAGGDGSSASAAVGQMRERQDSLPFAWSAPGASI
jgi:hypothetical protein